MLDTAENILILVLAVAGSLVFMAVLNKVWPSERRHTHNELIGWQLGILGTTYAVILGFMLYTVWTNYGAAELNADLEANALRNVYRLAEGLPPAQAVQLRAQARSYADAVIQHDWPDMAHSLLPEESHELNKNMWQTLMTVKTATQSESLAEDHALFELSSLTEHRRTRLIQSAYRLPTILWFVLIVGGILTVGSGCMFGSASTVLHGFQVFAFSMLITLVLLAIADINRPFQGSVHVSDYAFERARQSMNDE
jgi:hypothetical protein